MSKHTFVTESHAWGDEKKTVEVLSRAEVATIAAEAAEESASDLLRKLSSQERKLVMASEQAAAAFKDAAAARKTVERLVETARETFRDVIEELLAPHYRLLAQHLGIEVSAEKKKCKIQLGKDSASKNSKKKVSPSKKITLSKKVASSKKKVKVLKKTTASRSIRKGGKSCRKK